MSIEGIFDDTVFDDAGFEVGSADVEAFAAEQEAIELSFVQDHGPLRLLPDEIRARRALWVKRMRDWLLANRERRRREDLEVLTMYSLVTEGRVGL